MNIRNMLEFKKKYFPKKYKKYEEADEREKLEIEIEECQEKLDFLKQKLAELNRSANDKN